MPANQGRIYDFLRTVTAGAPPAGGGGPRKPPPPPYPGFMSGAQQRNAAGQAADAQLSPQLAALKNMIDQALNSGRTDAKLQSGFANAAAQVVQKTPSSSAQYAEQANIGDAFTNAYAKGFEDSMGGRGADAGSVLNALGGLAPDLMRVQGASVAKDDDLAVRSIIGRGQQNASLALLKGQGSAAELAAKKLEILAQRPELFQSALGQISTNQGRLADADATADYRAAALAQRDASTANTAAEKAAERADKARQTRIANAFKRADRLMKGGYLYDVDEGGRVYQVKDEKGNPVLTTSERGQQTLQQQRERQLQMNAQVLGLRAQDQAFDQTTTTTRLELDKGRYALDRARVEIAGKQTALREAQMERQAARQGQQDAYRQAKDEASRLTQSGQIYTVARVKGGYQIVRAMGSNGKPLLVGAAKPKTASGRKTGSLTAKGRVDLSARVETIVQAAAAEIDEWPFQKVVDELSKIGAFADQQTSQVAYRTLNRIYPPGTGGRPPVVAKQYLRPGYTFSLTNDGRVYVQGPAREVIGEADPWSPGYQQALKRATRFGG
jgi:hypothetical protein